MRPPSYLQYVQTSTTDDDYIVGTGGSGGSNWPNILLHKMYPTSATITATGTSFAKTSIMYFVDEGSDVLVDADRHIKYQLGQQCKIEMPDGGCLVLEASGAYQLLDKDAKITYKANRIREFNKYLNASDLIEEFILYLKGLGLTEREILAIPINLFIAFLVIRAAESDGEELPAKEQALLTNARGQLLLQAPAKRVIPRCTFCGRFIANILAAKALFFCSPLHAERAFAKVGR